MSFPGLAIGLFKNPTAEVGTVPSDPYFNNVVLLCHFDGANNSTNFIDVKSKTVTPSGNAKISTAQSKFGGSSAYFDGSGDYLSVADSDDWYFTGDFTIEFWVNFTSLPGINQLMGLVGQQRTDILGYWNIDIFNDSGIYKLGYTFNNANNTSFGDRFTGGAIDINQWYFIAIVRSGNTYSTYYNGVKLGEVTNSTPTVNFSSPLIIGATNLTANGQGITRFLNGYIDELRITKGIARYNSNFTPSNNAFADS